MESSGFLVDAAPRERRAFGYRWEDDAWHLEPTMAHGAFGAMGGIQTSATDYAKWAAYLLSAWPPRDDPGLGTGRARDGARNRAGLEFSSTLAAARRTLKDRVRAHAPPLTVWECGSR